MEISRSGYYEWKRRLKTHKVDIIEILIEAAFPKPRSTYGARRLKKVLAKQGCILSRPTIRNRIDAFIRLIEQYADVQTLAPEIVTLLIDKIAIHEKQTIEGVRTQRVVIHWHFIGNVEM